MRKKRNKGRDYVSIEDQKSMIGDKLNFTSSEAYKLLRANIIFSIADDKNCRIVGISSAINGEGKSTTAINLALTIAETGRKVLLLEADMRLPNFSKRLNIAGKPGLSNLLVGQNSLTDVLQESKINENLHIITAGDIPPNPSELLESIRMKVAVEALAENFKFIIIDLPPINVVSDALVVSKLADGMVMVVRQDYSNQHELARAMRQVDFFNIKILGFVMTRATHSEKHYKRYSKYGHKYGGRHYSDIDVSKDEKSVTDSVIYFDEY